MAADDAELKISHEESERISILKVWLCIMVVFVHAYKTGLNMAEGTVAIHDPAWLSSMKYIISQILASSAVPAFFFLSAYFLYRKPFSWKKNIAKKTRSLLVPYFILNAYWILVFFAGQQIPFIRPLIASPENIVADWDFGRWLGAFFGSPSRSIPMLSPLWFIRDLFVLNLLSFVFGWFVKKLGRFSLAVFILVWLLLDSTQIFFLDVQALCFWGIGCWFATRRKPVSSLDRTRAVTAAAYPCLVAAAYLVRNQGMVSLIVLRLCLLTGTVFWYVCATQIKKEKIRKRLLYISRYSFCIFLFHEMHLTFLQKILAKLMPQSAVFAVLEYFGIPVVIIAFCVVLSRLLEKYTPGFYRIISGGRSR